MNDGVVWVFDNPDIDVYLAFTVKIAASHLRKIRYTPYQYELWNICNSMREEGASFPAIAKYLNENGYKSARGKLFKNANFKLGIAISSKMLKLFIFQTSGKFFEHLEMFVFL